MATFKATFTFMFSADLFLIARKWNQLRCPYFSLAVLKYHDEMNVREKELISAQSSRLHYILVGLVRSLVLEAAAHTAFSQREESRDAGAQSTFSFPVWIRIPA